MRTLQIEVTYGETRSANFQSSTIHVTLRGELDDGEDENKCREALEWRCVAAVREAFDRADRRRLEDLCESSGAERP